MSKSSGQGTKRWRTAVVMAVGGRCDNDLERDGSHSCQMSLLLVGTGVSLLGVCTPLVQCPCTEAPQKTPHHHLVASATHVGKCDVRLRTSPEHLTCPAQSFLPNSLCVFEHLSACPAWRSPPSTEPSRTDGGSLDRTKAKSTLPAGCSNSSSFSATRVNS